MVYVYDESDSPLEVTLDKGGYGGYPLVDIWVKDEEQAVFDIYGSVSGKDGTWRHIDDLRVPHENSKERHITLATAYRFIKVSTESQTPSEVEITAGR